MADMLSGLSWQAGASSTLSVAGGRARCAAIDGAINPRIYKGPFTITNGVHYTFVGTIYGGTAVSAGGGQVYVRVSDNVGITSAGAYGTPWNTDHNMADQSFTAGYTGNAWFGIVPLVTTAGQYSEVDDAFKILDPGGDTGGGGGSVSDTQKLAYGGAGPVADACRLLLLTSGTLNMTNQKLKESGAGFWADMVRQGGTVLSS